MNTRNFGPGWCFPVYKKRKGVPATPLLWSESAFEIRHFSENHLRIFKNHLGAHPPFVTFHYVNRAQEGVKNIRGRIFENDLAAPPYLTICLWSKTIDPGLDFWPLSNFGKSSWPTPHFEYMIWGKFS